MDVQGWHLYLKDASAGKGLKIAQALAQQLGSEMSQGKLQPQDLEGILKKVRACSLFKWTQKCAVLWQSISNKHCKPWLDGNVLTTLPHTAGACLTWRWQGDAVPV